jgi:hypothetical protein
MESNALDTAKPYSRLGDVRLLRKGMKEQKEAEFARHWQACELAWRCSGSRRERTEINSGIRCTPRSQAVDLAMWCCECRAPGIKKKRKKQYLREIAKPGSRLANVRAPREKRNIEQNLL